MPRPQHVRDLERLSPHDMKPLVGADGPALITALQALVTWATSTADRERLMADRGFPLTGDLPAFLLVNQLVSRLTDRADAIRTGRPNVSKIVRPGGGPAWWCAPLTRPTRCHKPLRCRKPPGIVPSAGVVTRTREGDAEKRVTAPPRAALPLVSAGSPVEAS